MKSDNNTPLLKVKCPRCGDETIYAASNASRPFCSERCRLIDLGQWADESYRVPTHENASVQDSPPGENEYSNDDDSLS